jgi:hypothetical protein
MPQSVNFFSCFLYNSLDVDSYLSQVNVEFPFLGCCVLICIVTAESQQEVSLCNSNTSTKTEFGKQASCANYGTPMISSQAAR